MATILGDLNQSEKVSEIKPFIKFARKENKKKKVNITL